MHVQRGFSSLTIDVSSFEPFANARLSDGHKVLKVAFLDNVPSWRSLHYAAPGFEKFCIDVASILLGLQAAARLGNKKSRKAMTTDRSPAIIGGTGFESFVLWCETASTLSRLVLGYGRDRSSLVELDGIGYLINSTHILAVFIYASSLSHKMFNTISRRKHARPAFLNFRSSTAYITFVISFAVFTDQFLFAVILPVFPFSLHDRSHIPEDQVQLWVSILLGVYAIACCITSRESAYRYSTLTVTDLYQQSGDGTLTDQASVGCRGSLGLATSIIWSTGLAIMVDTVGEAHIGEYMGYVGIALNLGTLVAPILGGIVFSKAGYDAVFYMTFGVIAVDVLGRVFMIETETALKWVAGESDPAEKVGERDIEAIAGAASRDSVKNSTTTLDSGRAQTFRSTSPSSARAKSLKKGHLPPVITLLFSVRFLAALLGVVALAAIYSGVETVLPLYTERIFGWDSTGGGLIFLPFMLPSLLGPLFGKVVDRFGPRWPAAIGFALACPALILLRLVNHDTLDQKIILGVLLVMIGMGITLTMEPLMAEFTYMATRHDEKLGTGKTSYAQAYGLFNMAWAAGDTIGPFWAGLIVDAYGWGTMGWSLGLLAGISGVPAMLWCGGWIGGVERE
nr:putative mfs-type transporter c18.02 [Quercus suber]